MGLMLPGQVTYLCIHLSNACWASPVPSVLDTGGRERAENQTPQPPFTPSWSCFCSVGRQSREGGEHAPCRGLRGKSNRVGKKGRGVAVSQRPGREGLSHTMAVELKPPNYEKVKTGEMTFPGRACAKALRP